MLHIQIKTYDVVQATPIHIINTTPLRNDASSTPATEQKCLKVAKCAHPFPFNLSAPHIIFSMSVYRLKYIAFGSLSYSISNFSHFL